MCIFHPATCLICDWREGFLYVPCEDWMLKSLEDHPNLEGHLPPGTHLHCRVLRWPAWGAEKCYVCEPCLYEMSFLSGARNEKFYNAVLTEIHQRIDQRAKEEKPYVHRSLQTIDFCGAGVVDPDFIFPAKDGFPHHFRDQLARYDLINPVVYRRVRSYLKELTAHPRHDFWEVRVDQADSAWLTVWIPRCNICTQSATSINYEDEMGQEIEFEPNASAWKIIQFIDPDFAEQGLWFRIVTGTIVKPCLKCRSREEVFRKDVTDMLETSDNLDWVKALFMWLKQRPSDPNICWNDGWRDGALAPSAQNTSVPKDFRKELIDQAERIMDRKWDEMTTTPWKDIHLKPGTVHLYQRHDGVPPHPEYGE